MIRSLLLTFALLVTGCGDGGSPAATATPSPTPVPTQVDVTATAEPTATPTPTPETSPAPTPRPNPQFVVNTIDSIQLGDTLATMSSDARDLINNFADCRDSVKANKRGCLLTQFDPEVKPSDWDYYLQVDFSLTGKVILIYNGVSSAIRD